MSLFNRLTHKQNQYDNENGINSFGEQLVDPKAQEAKAEAARQYEIERTAREQAAAEEAGRIVTAARQSIENTNTVEFPAIQVEDIDEAEIVAVSHR